MSATLALVRYAPGVTQQYTTTSTTPSAIDTTNLTVSFVAPASGNVAIVLEAGGFASGGNANLWWGVGVHGGGVVLNTMVFITRHALADRRRATVKVTGLTPGNSYQYDWYFGSDSAGNSVGTNAGVATNPLTNTNGPAFMKVLAL